jgi:hypothetical protein
LDPLDPSSPPPPSWHAWLASPAGKRTTRLARWSFIALVTWMLVAQLSAVGWRDIFHALPRNPLFYLLFAAVYLQVSLGELLAYRLCWPFDARAAIPAFLKKRIYNREVLGYSGEVYFFVWARQHVPLPAIKLAETVRDQNIVSSVASTFVAVALVLFYLARGKGSPLAALREQLPAVDAAWLTLAGLLSLAAAWVAWRLRRWLFSMPLRLAATIFALHVVRLVIGQVLQIAQWEVGAPEGTLTAWFTLSAASIIASRIPILPSRDLLFVSAGVALSSAMDVETAAISGMLLVNAMLAKVVSFALFTALSLRERAPTGAGLPAPLPPSAPPQPGA